MLRIQSRCLIDDFFTSQAKSDFSSATHACQARQSLTSEAPFRLLGRPALLGTKQPPPSSVKLWKEKRLSEALVLAGISNAVFQANGHYRELKRFVNYRSGKILTDCHPSLIEYACWKNLSVGTTFSSDLQVAPPGARSSSAPGRLYAF